MLSKVVLLGFFIGIGSAGAGEISDPMLNCSDDSQPVGKRLDFKVMVGSADSGELLAEIYLRQGGRRLKIDRAVRLEKSEAPGSELSVRVTFTGERFVLETVRFQFPLVYVIAKLQAEDSEGRPLPERLRCGIDFMSPY